jgi:hypothetical protein
MGPLKNQTVKDQVRVKEDPKQQDKEIVFFYEPFTSESLVNQTPLFKATLIVDKDKV